MDKGRALREWCDNCKINGTDGSDHPSEEPTMGAVPIDNYTFRRPDTHPECPR